VPIVVEGLELTKNAWKRTRMRIASLFTFYDPAEAKQFFLQSRIFTTSDFFGSLFYYDVSLSDITSARIRRPLITPPSADGGS